MPLDDLAGGLLQGIGRFIVYLVVDILLEIVFYFIGKYSLRILTVGKYPPKYEEKHCEGCVQAFGIVVFIAIAVGPFLITSI